MKIATSIGRNNFLGSIFLLLFPNTLQLVSLLGNKNCTNVSLYFERKSELYDCHKPLCFKKTVGFTTTK